MVEMVLRVPSHISPILGTGISATFHMLATFQSRAFKISKSELPTSNPACVHDHGLESRQVFLRKAAFRLSTACAQHCRVMLKLLHETLTLTHLRRLNHGNSRNRRTMLC